MNVATMKHVVFALVIGVLYAIAVVHAQSVCANIPDGVTTNVRHPRDCTRFTLCLGSQEIPRECAPGMHFSESFGDCDLAKRANCIPETAPPQPEPEDPIDPNNPCSRHINFEVIASATNCGEYIVCACGQPNVQQCAAGLVFDSRTLTCNVATAATCVTAASARPVCPRQPGNVPHPNDCKHFFLCLGTGSTPTLRLCPARMHFNRAVNQCDRVACTVAPPVPTLFGRMDMEDRTAHFDHPRFMPIDEHSFHQAAQNVDVVEEQS